MNNLCVAIELVVTSTLSQEELQALCDKAVEAWTKEGQFIHAEEPFVYVDTWH